MNLINQIPSFIIWNQNPEIFRIPLSIIGLGDRPIVWYGLLFALAFVIAQQIMYWIFQTEGRPKADVDKLTTYMVLATVVGARLGHCLFYDPIGYLSNPIEIIKIWEGGLASHGGALGILIAVYIFVKKNPSYTWFWMVDRLVIVVALVGAMIRTGNLMNSEMEGIETKANYGIVYARGTTNAIKAYSKSTRRGNGLKINDITYHKGGKLQSDVQGWHPITIKIEYKKGDLDSPNGRNWIEKTLANGLKRSRESYEHISFGDGLLNYDLSKEGGTQVLNIYALGISRHASQIYEAMYCLLLMVILLWLWKNKRSVLPPGFLFALFNILLWSLRFFDEFLKMNQESFEDNIPLNMGQWLSMPLFTMGVVIMIYIYRKKTLNKTL